MAERGQLLRDCGLDPPERVEVTPYLASNRSSHGGDRQADLSLMLAWVDTSYHVRGDLNLDGVTNEADTAALLSNWNVSLGRGVLAGASEFHRFGYTGHRHDEAIPTLVHARHRVLLTELGRWTRRDPLGYIDGMSLYEYVRGRPIVAQDVMGLAMDWARPLVPPHQWPSSPDRPRIPQMPGPRAPAPPQPGPKPHPWPGPTCNAYYHPKESINVCAGRCMMEVVAATGACLGGDPNVPAIAPGDTLCVPCPPSGSCDDVTKILAICWPFDPPRYNCGVIVTPTEPDCTTDDCTFQNSRAFVAATLKPPCALR